MIEKQNSTRNRLAARWQEITASPSLLRTLAENFSQVARDAFAETKTLITERQTVFLQRLPAAFDGLRVVQLSDIHHSPYTDAAQIKKTVEIANALEPDLIVLTGDYVSHETEYIAPVAELLGKCRAKHGVYAILGNHDHMTDAALMLDSFRAANIKVLINEGFRFELNGASMWICGVDETMFGLDDLPQALKGSRPEELKFLLCHNPSILGQAEKLKIDFVVSGHTHGGQVRWRTHKEDLNLPHNRRASGLLSQGDTQIYISRGIGTVVFPVRYQCPPEISLLELRTADCELRIK